MLATRLTTWGLDGTELEIRDGAAPRKVAGPELQDLISIIDGIWTQFHLLLRRSINPQELLLRHRDPETGLPRIRAVTYRPGLRLPITTFVYSDKEFAELVAGGGVRPRRGRADREPADGRRQRRRCPSTASSGRTCTSAPRWKDCSSQLEQRNIPLEDLFAVRKRDLSGEPEPARYVLLHDGVVTRETREHHAAARGRAAVRQQGRAARSASRASAR